VRSTRILKHMTLRELGQQTGIILSRLSDLEHGRAVPTTAEADALCLALGPKIQFAEKKDAEKKAAELKAHLEEARLASEGEVPDNQRREGMRATLTCDNFITILDEVDTEALLDFDMWFWMDKRERFGYVQLWGFDNGKAVVYDVIQRDDAWFMWE
jgi:transcriptional regulator with XRE-family HTH domain